MPLLWVSVDQVGADIGTTGGSGESAAGSGVSVDQVGADIGTYVLSISPNWLTRCPSIRLVPTSAPEKLCPACRVRVTCPSIRLVPTSAPCVCQMQKTLGVQCPSIRLVPTSAP